MLREEEAVEVTEEPGDTGFSGCTVTVLRGMDGSMFRGGGLPVIPTTQ